MTELHKKSEKREAPAVEAVDEPAPGAAGTEAAPSAAQEGSTETPALTAAEVQELKEQAAKAKEHWDRLLRTAADLENYKKRAARERQEAIKYANEALLTRLIPVLDNFDIALAAAANVESSAAQSLQTGISMIYQQLKKSLAEAGLEEIDALNQPFDPNLHEAVSQQESSEAPEGHVVQQLRKGYKLRDRLLRPAGVVVAKKPAPASEVPTSPPAED